MGLYDFLWRALVIGGCGLAVFCGGFSGWWFLLALMLF